MENYTQIENEVLEALITSNLSKAELCVALFVLRKTNGFHKTQDEISFSQFIDGTELSRQTIANCLKQLQLVKIIRLVKKGTSKKSSNLWVIEKNVDKWQLVKRIRLVKFPVSTSQVSANKLVNTSRLTKESTKESTKERGLKSTSQQTESKSRSSSRIYKDFIDYFNKLTDRNLHYGNRKAERQLKARLKDGYKLEDFGKAIQNVLADDFHKEHNFKHLTPEFITRSDKLEKFLNVKSRELETKTLSERKAEYGFKY